MNRFFTIGFFVAILLVFAGTSFIPTEGPVNTVFNTPLQTLSIGSATIDVAVADNQRARHIGLSHLASLPSGRGLFLVFNDSDIRGIWMKDMKFPIDIIWLDEQLRVVDIHKNISPDTYPTTFYSSVPARFVLEVNAGFSSEYDVTIGSVCTFSTS